MSVTFKLDCSTFCESYNSKYGYVLGKDENNFVKLEFNSTKNEFLIKLSHETPQQNFAEMTRLLSAAKKIHFLESRLDFKEEKKRFEELLEAINAKVAKTREKYCPSGRLYACLTDQLPVPITSVSIIDDKSNLKNPVIIDYKHSTEALPHTASIIDRLTRSLTACSSSRYKFHSITGRAYCLLWSVAFAVLTLAMPILAIISFCVNRHKHKWEEKCYQVLDAFYGVVFTPFVALAACFKCVGGAVFHPGIVIKNIRMEPKLKLIIANK